MKYTGVPALILLSTLVASGQQHSQGERPDSDATKRAIIVDPGLSLGKPTLLLPPSLRDDTAPVIPPFLLSEKSPGIPVPFLGGSPSMKVDLTSPLRLQMAREERLRPLWTVLGTVEVGGAAYAAYRYIKKHGLK